MLGCSNSFRILVLGQSFLGANMNVGSFKQFSNPCIGDRFGSQDSCWVVSLARRAGRDEAGGHPAGEGVRAGTLTHVGSGRVARV